jgi:hypothetical protein
LTAALLISGIVGIGIGGARGEPVAGPATKPATAPAQLVAPVPGAALTDPQLDASIRRGVDFLLSAFKDGELPPERDSVSESHRQALHALCVYALLSAGQTISDPRLDPNSQVMGPLIAKLKAFPLTPNYNLPPQMIVYTRSMRAAALAIRNRPDDRKVLEQDVAWLIAAEVGGAYSWDDRHTNPAGQKAIANIGIGGNPPPSGINNVGMGGGGVRNVGIDPNGRDVQVLPTNTRPPQQQQRSIYGGGGGGGIVGSWPPRVHATPLGHGYGFGATRGPAYVPPKPTGPLVASMVSRPVGAVPGGHAAAGGGNGAAGPRVGAAAAGAPRPGVAPIGGGMGVAPVGGPTAVVTVPPPPFPWDNYNSQFAVMGVAAGAETGIAVPSEYWDRVQKHWQTSQRIDGTWPYADGEGGSLAMTAGGLASIVTAFDWCHRTNSMKRLANDAIPPEANRALEWLEQRGNVVQIPTPTTDYVGLDAFTVLRAAQRFGLKYIGGHDWYLELAQRFVTGQFPNGSWGRVPNLCADTMIDTAYTVTFLAQGRPPVMMNKLRHDVAEWQNHPHDLANLAAFTGRALEQSLRWQVVDLSRDGSDWTDAPILYITGEQTPRLRQPDLAKIKAFVDAGGMIFTHADLRGRPFTEWVNKTLAPAILPAGAELKPLPDEHAIYSIANVLKTKPRLLAGGNGARLLLVHSPNDLGAKWEMPAERGTKEAFQLGQNLYVYATGKMPPAHRLIPPAKLARANVALTVNVARLKHAGNWDPEPAAWTQFSDRFYAQTGAAAEIRAITIAELSPQITLAHLAADTKLQLTDAEIPALKAYVESGGVLLLESFDGDPAATTAVRKNVLDKAFPTVAFEKPSPAQPPLLKAQDVCDDLQHRGVRPFVAAQGGVDQPLLVAAVGKGYVVVSALDLSSGLADAHAWGINGYTPAYAGGIVKNLLVWAGTRGK